jgi:hypothetical protein
MRGETWTPAVDWSASAVSSRSGTASCCSWTGITCDEYQRCHWAGRVESRSIRTTRYRVVFP